MREVNAMEACGVAGGVAYDGSSGFVQCMNDNWWENTITGAVGGAVGGAFFGPGAVLGGIVGGIGGSTGTGVYCGLTAIF